MERNIPVAPRLPMADALGESGLAAIRAPIAISVRPMSRAVLRMPNLSLVQEKSGLVETMGLMFSASYSANFSAPTHNRLPASADRATPLPAASSAAFYIGASPRHPLDYLRLAPGIVK